MNPVFEFGIGFGGTKPLSLSYEDLMGKKVDDERRCDLMKFDVGDALDLVAASNLEFYNLKTNRPPNVVWTDSAIEYLNAIGESLVGCA